MTRDTADDVLVVGGGIIGLAIAREAARAGLGVRLLEADVIGRGASGAAAGLLSPQAGADRDDPLFRLTMRSRDLYPAFAAEVAEESGVDPDLGMRGSLQVAKPGEGTAAIDRCFAFQHALGLAVERLDRAALRAAEPSLHPDFDAGLFLPRDGAVDNVMLVDGLKRAAGRRGVRLEEGTRVDRLLLDNGRVQGAEAGGRRARAGTVVLAAGAWSGQVADAAPVTIPSSPVRGQIVCLGPAAVPALPVFHGHRYLVRRRDGRVLSGSTMEDAGFDARVTGAGLRELSAAAIDLVPALAQAPFHSAWAGLRPGTPDGLPAIGRAAPGLVVATGHLRNGILLAPITARLVVSILLGRDTEIDAAPFDPGRFRRR